jgi:hypothetical protein
MDHYQVEVKCWNCKRVNWVSGIPQGMSVESHIEKLGGMCKNCGCPLIKQKEEKEEKTDGKKAKGKK